MTRPILYKAAAHHGVVTLLTPDAYLAFLRSTAYQRVNGSWEGINPSLRPRIAAGTMTFGTPSSYANYLELRISHCGDLRLLATLEGVCEIISFDETFSVPFSSGDLDSYARLREQGFGPKPELVGKLIAEGLRANVEEAEALLAEQPGSHLIAS